MKKIKKKLGRPPAKWMFEVLEMDFADSWTDAYEIAQALKQNVRTVKSFLGKLEITPRHVVDGGKARAKYKVGDVRKGVKGYVEAWV